MLFQLEASPSELFTARYMVETELRDALERVGRCDNSPRDKSAGSSPYVSRFKTIYAGVYAVGKGPTGIHAALAKMFPKPLHIATNLEQCVADCQEQIKSFVDALTQFQKASAKAGASSLGVELDGKPFDSTKGRWRQHLGAYYKIPK